LARTLSLIDWIDFLWYDGLATDPTGGGDRRHVHAAAALRGLLGHLLHGRGRDDVAGADTHGGEGVLADRPVDRRRIDPEQTGGLGDGVEGRPRAGSP
jgi:hypothetical protein